MKVTHVHMRAVGDGSVEMTIRRGRVFETDVFPSWGEALATVNLATAFNGAPDPTPSPSGTPVVEILSERKAA